MSTMQVLIIFHPHFVMIYIYLFKLYMCTGIWADIPVPFLSNETHLTYRSKNPNKETNISIQTRQSLKYKVLRYQDAVPE